MPISARRLIVYDLDGTLADTREDITRSANHMRAEMDLGPLTRDEICRHVGLGLHQLVEKCLETTDAALVERGMRIYRAYYSQHLLDHTVLYPSVMEVLEYCRTYSQAVITNKPNPYSREILERLRVADFFAEIVGGESSYGKKPEPASLLAIMRREGIRPEETLMVGDSPIDVETGRRAGVATVGVAQGFSGREELAVAAPDTLVGNFDELLELVRQWDR
jgi:phosphoglycolate phosphatase